MEFEAKIKKVKKPFSVLEQFSQSFLSLYHFLLQCNYGICCTHTGQTTEKKRFVSAKCRKQSSKQQKMEKKKKKFKLTLAQASPIADTNYQTIGHKAHCSLRFPLCAVLFISLFFSHPRHSLQ